MKEYSIQEGLEKILDLSKDVSNKPILIAVYGESNSGKSFFLHYFRSKVGKKGVEVGWANTTAKDSDYETIKYFDYFLIHSLPHEEPDSMTQKHIGKPVDINVYIYNPHLTHPIKDFNDDIWKKKMRQILPRKRSYGS